ncbi:1,5-anhydro-D-fructose reductase [Hartmannibacter diazotrophicus]|uniref:1,5-anhydro-D-fructose reductase n=1 Tax=Hartmannibacter diazotrophicus TaxID=1482074 RepID=A0A2C9D9N5_9HYPH|nr:Gfo/Idh/MocA family oxidoreductase [Hartmannibacter diazotrophicus]SON56899.1 1,5-anhydro-D-fructose reductase [Hartmannibacter diazotrophicus]
MRKIRWGVLSTAKIGRELVIPAIMNAANAELVAIASRDEARAKALADSLGVAKAYGSYEAMLADPEIDAIYNPLPNHLHVDLTLAAARAGKHVLCEKPIGMDLKDAERLRESPKNVFVMEAFMIRFHPQWQRVRDIVASGDLGEVRAVQTFFSYFNDDPSNVRNMADIGGGGILDIGCYAITSARMAFGSDPKRVVSLIDRDPAFGTDRLASALIDFGDGKRCDFTVSTQLVPFQRVHIMGTRKRLTVLIPFNQPTTDAILQLSQGARGDTDLETIVIDGCDQYQREVEAFSEAIATGTPLPYGIEDALVNMATLDAIFESERTNGWVSLG